jgi:RNA polymerase sigma-70 factor, ECF subfamily
MSKAIEAKKQDAADCDLEYVAACQKGDTEAFSVLVARHSKKMLNIANRMLGDYDEACDVTQEAFIAAFRSIRKFRADSKFSTWLYRIVVNLAKNRVKMRQNLLKREGLKLEAADVSGDCAACLAASNGDNPALQLERRELANQVQTCIDALEGDYREVLVLRDIEGLAYEEIRDILQIASGTVKSRLSRARLAMKECLKKVIGSL